MIEKRSPRQEAAQAELEARGYSRVSSLFNEDRSMLVENWRHSMPDRPSILFTLWEDGGWELFVQPTVSNETAKTWAALDSHINVVRKYYQVEQ